MFRGGASGPLLKLRWGVHKPRPSISVASHTVGSSGGALRSNNLASRTIMVVAKSDAPMKPYSGTGDPVEITLDVSV